MYYTYILRCEDNTLYTGITTDLKRRFLEHHSRSDKCAKYTLNHLAIELEAAWESKDRSSASKLEYNLKKLTKKEKEDIIKNNKNIFILEHKLNCNEYKRIEI